jgi:hypothetical protein
VPSGRQAGRLDVVNTVNNLRVLQNAENLSD